MLGDLAEKIWWLGDPKIQRPRIVQQKIHDKVS